MSTFDEHLKKLNFERAMAVYNESVIRESAFLSITLDICGIEINQLTLKHYILLDFARNPLLNGGEVKAEDVLAFLWIVSLDYKDNDKIGFEHFVKTKCFELDYPKAVDEIVKYVESSLLDLTAQSNTTTPQTNRTPYYSWVASYIDMLASNYGWSVEYIMSLPIAQVLQFTRIIEERTKIKNNQQVSFVNRLSDEATSNITKFLNLSAQEQNKILVTPDDGPAKE